MAMSAWIPNLCTWIPFLVTLIVLAIWRPSWVMRKGDDGEQRLSVSHVLGLACAAGIIVGAVPTIIWLQQNPRRIPDALAESFAV